jgi:phospholipid/cholesterol/gamma-HCH transport system ATP-binding protein
MQEENVQLAIRVRDLVVGFGRQVVIDHLTLDVRGARSLAGRRFRWRQSVLMRTIAV